MGNALNCLVFRAFWRLLDNPEMASESQAALLCSHVNENDGSALGTNLSFENQLKKLLRPIGEPNVDFGQHAINQKQWILKR